MPGTFTKQNRPDRPGSYFNWEAVQAAIVPPSVGSIVALPFVHDWGPFQRATLVTTFSEWQSIFGKSTDTEGYKAAKMAFLGEGVAGRGGAGGVLCYRMGGSAAAKATRSLLNAAATPVTALTATAKYEGTMGNDLRITVQDKSGDSAKTELILLDGTLELERYEFADADIQAVVDKINLRSSWIAATLVNNGVALTPVSSAALTGGNDGATLVSQDYTDAETALEVERFSLIAFPNLTDSGILASLADWVEDQNAAGKRFMAVVGGATNESVDDAITRSASFASEHFVNVGVGSVEDANLLDANGDPTVLSTAQLAPRVAGIIAQRGEAMSITFARLAGLTILVGPTDAEVSSAFKGGVTVLGRDSNVDAPVRIEKGLTTFTDDDDVDKPLFIYRTPKYIRTMDGVQNELQEWSDENIVGKLPVNNKTRDFALGETRARLSAREKAGVIQPGWTAEVDPNPAPSDQDEFVAIRIGLLFGRSTEQVYFTARVG